MESEEGTALSSFLGASRLANGLCRPDVILVLAITRASALLLAKHSKSLSLIDCISVGVDRMQRNLEPVRKQVEAWQGSELADVTAKVVIYQVFVEGKLEAPKHLAGTVYDL